MNPHPRPSAGGKLLAVTRIWLPIAIAAVGIVLIVVGRGHYSDLADRKSLQSAAGVALLLVALIVWMVNWMFRLSIESNHDREREEEAREYFDRHGHWPDEDPR